MSGANLFHCFITKFFPFFIFLITSMLFNAIGITPKRINGASYTVIKIPNGKKSVKKTVSGINRIIDSSGTIS